MSQSKESNDPGKNDYSNHSSVAVYQSVSKPQFSQDVLVVFLWFVYFAMGFPIESPTKRQEKRAPAGCLGSGLKGVAANNRPGFFSRFRFWYIVRKRDVVMVINGDWWSFWVNYNISLTWIQAIWGWFPLFTKNSHWGRSEVVIIHPDHL